LQTAVAGESRSADRRRRRRRRKGDEHGSEKKYNNETRGGLRGTLKEQIERFERMFCLFFFFFFCSCFFFFCFTLLGAQLVQY
jgi:hypothetical protein